MKKLLLLAGLTLSCAVFAQDQTSTQDATTATQQAQPAPQNQTKYHVVMPKMPVCLYADLAYSEGAVLYAESGTSYKCTSAQDSMRWQKVEKTEKK